MRIFVAFEGLCESFDISPENTVQDVKLMIKILPTKFSLVLFQKSSTFTAPGTGYVERGFSADRRDYFHVPLSEDKKGRRYLELIYAGAVLKDNWVLSDVGITVSSSIKCVVKEEDKPIFYVYNAVTHEKLPIMGRIYLLSSKVSELKNLVTLKCGLPSSIYCLRTPEGREMFDCNTLNNYQLDIGTTLHLDVWDGWREFLTSCIIGSKLKIQYYLSKEEPILRYQKKVALYIAAFFGHLQVSTWLLKKGVKPTETIGVHPYREWCQEDDHSKNMKSPVHAAAEAGQLMILKAFVNYSALSLECQNSAGQTPLQLCIQHRHKDCVLYLVTKLWSVVSYPTFSLPMKIYIKLKLWLLKSQNNLYSTRKCNPDAVFRTRVGDIVFVDGFTKPEMTSRGFFSAMIKHASSRGCTLPDLNNRFQHKQSWYHLTTSDMYLKEKNVRFPPVAGTKKRDNKDRHCQKRKPRKKNTRLSEEYMDQNMCLARVPLPSNSVLKPAYYYSIPNVEFLLNPSLESFSKYCGRTPRENAIYCLAIASEFKEKPWLQQLDIAKTLARKSVCNPTY